MAIEDDMLWEDVLATLRWCVRIAPVDRVMVLHVSACIATVASPFPGVPARVLADLIGARAQRSEQLRAARRLKTWDIEAESTSRCPTIRPRQILPRGLSVRPTS